MLGVARGSWRVAPGHGHHGMPRHQLLTGTRGGPDPGPAPARVVSPPGLPGTAATPAAGWVLTLARASSIVCKDRKCKDAAGVGRRLREPDRCGPGLRGRGPSRTGRLGADLPQPAAGDRGPGDGRGGPVPPGGPGAPAGRRCARRPGRAPSPRGPRDHAPIRLHPHPVGAACAATRPDCISTRSFSAIKSGPSGSHAPAWEQVRALRVQCQERTRSVRTAFPRGAWEREDAERRHGIPTRSVGTRGRARAARCSQVPNR